MNYGRHNRVYIDQPPRVGTADSNFTIPSNLGIKPDITRNEIFPHFSTSKINEDIFSEKHNERQDSDGIYIEQETFDNELGMTFK